MEDRTQHIVDSIDGALADGDFPDAMRWSPEPEHVDAPAPYDGELVWQPPQRYEQAGPLLPAAARREARDPRTYGLVEVALPRPPDEPVHRSGYAWNGARLEYEPNRLLTRPPQLTPEQIEQGIAEMQEVFRRIGSVVAQTFEEFGKIATAIGRSVTEVVESLRPQTAPPSRSLRQRDPRAYALELRRARNTGPDRQVQNRPRPRVHR